jgi:sugar phosphate isomerase/epimerase
MDLQVNALIPPGMPAGETMERLATLDHSALVGDLANDGFDLVELSGDLALLLPHTFAPQAIQELAAVKRERNLAYTAHIPLWSLELATPLEPVRGGSVQAVVDFIRVIQPLEPEVYVLHATGPLAAEFTRMKLPPVAKAFTLRLFQSKARQSLETILVETGIPSRSLAVETIEFPFDLTMELAEEFDLSICLDVGHVLAGFSGPIGIHEALEATLPRLGEVHLHDGPWQGPERRIVYGQDHKTLGRGDLDTGRFLDQLVEAGYDGPVILELTTREALDSVQVIRELRPNLIG